MHAICTGVGTGVGTGVHTCVHALVRGVSYDAQHRRIRNAAVALNSQTAKQLRAVIKHADMLKTDWCSRKQLQ